MAFLALALGLVLVCPLKLTGLSDAFQPGATQHEGRWLASLVLCKTPLHLCLCVFEHVQYSHALSLSLSLSLSL